METLLHYTWKHRLFPVGSLRTTMGLPLEIIDTGLYNYDAGPDFFNAKLKIDGQLWVGNVEIHERASDWNRHGHQHDAHYNNVVLHVCRTIDCEVQTQAGGTPPQFELHSPPHLEQQYSDLIHEEHFPPCHRVIPAIPSLSVHHWMNILAIERLSYKTERIRHWIERTKGDWERVFFISLARAFGFGKNSDAFELWANTIDLQQIGKHRDNPMQVEAFFFGQAGLLAENTLRPEQIDDYFRILQREYLFLQHKFSLSPIAASQWKFLRPHPQNFPYRRLAQLAALYSTQKIGFAQIKNASSREELHHLLNIPTPEYWRTHYVFGEVSTQSNKVLSQGKLSHNALDLLIINAVAPVLAAYGKQHQDNSFIERAVSWLENIRPEQNHITRAWQAVGLTPQHAADSQALLHLRQHYCDRKDCLRCQLGTYYLKHSTKQSSSS